ncbi:MAG: Glutathione S-transferase [Pseudomonadota bacterium]|jgi:glutathione S-transferase
MSKLTLFHFPGACSRVTMIALEQVGADYDDVMVNLMAGEHRAPAYQGVNPRGKVPALLIDGELLSENAAILTWIDSQWPGAGLLPQADDALTRARYLSDLFWISSVWHPYVRANKAPMRWTTGDVAPVRERGVELLTPCVEQLDARLAAGTWWYGDHWSILDVYFYWAYTTAAEGAFPLSPFANIARHRTAIEAMPAFARMQAREAAAKARAETARG